MRSRLAWSLILLAVAGAWPLLAADPKSAPSETFAKQVAPLLSKYCLDCHNGQKRKAGLDLEHVAGDSAILKDPDRWELVLDMLASGDMPPQNKPKPTPAEVETITKWIEAVFSKRACQGPADPGRVTLRRLNRAEYNNTIRDLIGVDFQPADDFPSDDVGYGFDNIGDVLTLPPILVEKYLAAAESIAERAIVADEKLDDPVKRIEVEKLRDRSGGEKFEDGRILSTNGEIALRHVFTRDADYLIRVRTYGQQAGDEPVKLAIKVDGQERFTAEVRATKNEPNVLEAKLKIEGGKNNRPFSIAFLNDFYQPDAPDPDRRDRNLVVDWVEVKGPLGLGEATLPESHKRIIYRNPKTKDDWRACATAILERFASRAYRRPARPEEVARLVKLVEMAGQDGERFERAIQIAVQAVLVSPNFLFRVEGDGPGTAARAINDFELASRLSYFLWSSMPDKELLFLAGEKKLGEPHQLELQVKRMLKDPKARALVDNFGMQWLQVRNLDLVNPDTGSFPQFDNELRQAMRRETELFFEEVVREDCSILNFLDADFTYLNERLARHYGIPGVEGEAFKRVALKDDRRGGVLTQASILTITSNPTRTSPVKRGKWILEQVLGTPPPPPPPDVPLLKEDKQAVLSGTLRQRLEQHRSVPDCATCHNRMDPLGFGLENFDAVGAWRDRDGDYPVDASGTLPSGQSFEGPKQLKDVLKAKKQDFKRCLTEKMLTYALGRGLEFEDRCVVDRIVGALGKDGDRFSRLVLEIVKSEPFRLRKGRGDQS